ncbi:MAG: response regulator transcription factor [Candidatus Galacturonibacter soehngenii]|nr:response regulator transcription factor [Candidatus Galacturonibacter soehngenii]
MKVLVVDDHPIVREGLKLIFETEEEIEIVDEATNGLEALILIQKKEYDLILLDISMPKMNGLEFLQEKEKIGNTTGVIILTTVDDKDVIRKAMSFGVRGFLLKDAKREEMVQTVLDTAKGKETISPEIVKIMEGDSTIQKKRIGSPAVKNKENALTEKEMAVLCKVVKGAASKEIAIDMGITERTVKAHLTNIYRKLEVNSRTEAVALAIIRKLVLI